MINRRSFLKRLLFLGSLFSFTSCDDSISYFTKELGQNIPENIDVQESIAIDSDTHFLLRTTYGIWPGDLEYIKKIGQQKWLEEQLHPEKIDDIACNLRARRFETLHHHPSTCYDYKKKVLRQEIVKHTFLRALYSKRQLFEVMVSFWTNHFNIHIEKGDCIYLKTSDDRDVIRKHALGKFRDLLRASAISPAMLVYLDGKSNQKNSAKDVPNENYARELLELHTLGVHGGYSQQDVYEVARALTGWRLRTKWQKGTVYFDTNSHDHGEKHILGQVIAADGGAKDLDDVIDIVCNHPSTAKYLATKLVHFFVGTNTVTSLIEKVSSVFAEQDGDIRAMLRTILFSPEFQQSQQQKFKRPFRFMISVLRQLGADVHVSLEMIEYLNKMGQVPFQYPTPDGYPDEMEPWLGTLLWRWNFAHAVVANKVQKSHVDLKMLLRSLKIQKPEQFPRLFSYFMGRLPTENDQKIFSEYVATKDIKDFLVQQELVGLLLCSPQYQRY